MTSLKYDFKGNRDFYGLGLVVWWQNGHRIFFHGGGMPGVSANLFVVPEERLSIAIVANKEDADIWPLVKTTLREYQPDLYPRKNLEEANPVPLGTWFGTIDSSVQRPFSIAISSSDRSDPMVTIGGYPMEITELQSLDDGFFKIELVVDHPLSLEIAARYLRLKMKQRGGNVQGYLTAIGRPGVDHGVSARSYWVNLNSRP